MTQTAVTCTVRVMKSDDEKFWSTVTLLFLEKKSCSLSNQRQNLPTQFQYRIFLLFICIAVIFYAGSSLTFRRLRFLEIQTLILKNYLVCQKLQVVGMEFEKSSTVHWMWKMNRQMIVSISRHNQTNGLITYFSSLYAYRCQRKTDSLYALCHKCKMVSRGIVWIVSWLINLVCL